MTLRIILPLLAISLCQMTAAEAVITSHHHPLTQQVESPPDIRVLILHDVPKADLEIQGGYRLIDPYQGSSLGRRLHGKRRLIEALPMGIRWGEEFPGVFQLKVIPTGPDSMIFVDGVPYLGTVTFYDIGGVLSAVNELPVEDYVTSLLANQEEELPQEALSALVIAARSQAYYQASHPRNPYWDVDSQNSEYAGYLESPVAMAAVDTTRFMVLTRNAAAPGELEVVPALWSARGSNNTKGQRVLVFTEAVSQAKSGAHAAQILEKAFPGTTLRRLYGCQ